MILVTGATGNVGAHVLRLLISRGEHVRAMTRRPERLPVPGVDVVQADFDDPASLRRAVAGVHAVFLLTAPRSPTPRHDVVMLDAARSAAVTAVVKLSAIGTGEQTEDGRPVGGWHEEAEDAVRTSGLAWTLLRPSTFATNSLSWAKMINAGRPVTNLTGSGTQGIVDPGDVAAVAVEALTSPLHTGRTYTLTGPELLSVPDQAAVLERVLGRRVETVDLPPEKAREQLLSSGMEEAVAEVILTGSAWVRSGQNAILTEDVLRILGRPPNSFETWAHEHRAAFLNP